MTDERKAHINLVESFNNRITRILTNGTKLETIERINLVNAKVTCGDCKKCELQQQGPNWSRYMCMSIRPFGVAENEVVCTRFETTTAVDQRIALTTMLLDRMDS